MAEQQLIISISREFGSGGHEIAEALAKKLDMKLYDRNILDEMAKEKNINPEHWAQVDEKPKNIFLSRRVQGHTNSSEENLAFMQFDYLQKKADKGESFIVVGRCSETALKDHKELISVFVTGQMGQKIKHVAGKYNLSEEKAVAKIKRHDKRRKRYHNHFSDFQWGDSRHYDICINSSLLGIEKTTEILETLIRTKIGE